MQGPGIGEADLKHHAVRQVRVDIAPARGDFADCRQQQRRIAVLGGIPSRTDLQRPGGHLCLVMHRQHQDGRRVVQRADPRNRLQAVDPGHGDIQQHHLAGRVTQGFQQLFAVTRLAHHQQVLGQADQLLDAFTDDGVVFGYQYADHGNFLSL